MTSIPLSDLESSSSAKFDTVGQKHSGIITAIDHRQQTDLDGKPKLFPSGDPMMMYVITIQPDGGDAVALWAKGGNYTPAKGTGMAMLPAIAAAAREAGATAIEVGAQLAVAFTGEGEARVGMNAPKLYTAQYRSPAAKPQAVEVDDLFS